MDRTSPLDLFFRGEKNPFSISSPRSVQIDGRARVASSIVVGVVVLDCDDLDSFSLPLSRSVPIEPFASSKDVTIDANRKLEKGKKPTNKQMSVCAYQRRLFLAF